MDKMPKIAPNFLGYLINFWAFFVYFGHFIGIWGIYPYSINVWNLIGTLSQGMLLIFGILYYF